MVATVVATTATLSSNSCKKNIFIWPIAKTITIYNTNIMCKHRGGFPEVQSPIVQDTQECKIFDAFYFRSVPLRFLSRALACNCSLPQETYRSRRTVSVCLFTRPFASVANATLERSVTHREHSKRYGTLALRNARLHCICFAVVDVS